MLQYPHTTPHSTPVADICCQSPAISGTRLVFVAAYGKVARKLLEKVALKYHRDTRQQRRIDRVLLEKAVDIGAVAAEFTGKPRYASFLSH